MNQVTCHRFHILTALCPPAFSSPNHNASVRCCRWNALHMAWYIVNAWKQAAAIVFIVTKCAKPSRHFLPRKWRKYEFMTPSVQRAEPGPLLNPNKAPALSVDTSSCTQPRVGNPRLPVRHTGHSALLPAFWWRRSGVQSGPLTLVCSAWAPSPFWTQWAPPGWCLAPGMVGTMSERPCFLQRIALSTYWRFFFFSPFYPYNGCWQKALK